MLGISQQLTNEFVLATSGSELLPHEFAALRILLGQQGCTMVAVGFYSRFSPVLFLLLTVTLSCCLGLRCKEREYAFGAKCCKDCAPGK